MRNKKIFFKIPTVLFGLAILLLVLSFFPLLTDYRDFLLFTGISSLFFGAARLFFHPKTVYRSVSETLKSPAARKQAVIPFAVKKNQITTIFFILIIGGFLINQLFFLRYNTELSKEPVTIAKNALNPIDESIKAELLSKGKEVPILGNTHYHADLNLYVNGERIELASPVNFTKSSFMHLDGNPNPDAANSILHIHAQNVPLWVFFKSLGMNLTKDSLTLAGGRILKNENNYSLKFYLNGKKVEDLTDYIPQTSDKLLISYGPENDAALDREIKAMTNFAKDYQK